MASDAYGQFSVILRQRTGVPSSLTTYETIMLITEKLARYNGIFNVAASPPNFIVHLATLEQQLDMLSWKQLDGPGYLLDIVPWSSEYVSLALPWNTHCSKPALPSATSVIDVQIPEKDMSMAASPDFSYLMILELKDFYYSKVHAFLKCEEACKQICDLVRPFSEDLSPRIAAIYKQAERYSSIPPPEILSAVARFGDSLNYQDLFIGEEIFSLHITMESIYRSKKDAIPLHMYQANQPNGKLASPSESNEILKAIFAAAINSVYPGTVIMTAHTESSDYIYTKISSNVFSHSYKLQKPATQADAEAVSCYRFLKYMTNVLGYNITDKNSNTLAEVVSQINECTHTVSDFQYCVNAAHGMILAVEKNVKNMYAELLNEVPSEHIPHIMLNVDSLICLIGDYSAAAERAFNSFCDKKRCFTSIKLSTLYPAKADAAWHSQHM